jgi:hypothetical protein
VVAVPVATGLKVKVEEMLCSEMVFGLPPLGNVPTSWSGIPFDVSDRVVSEHDHLTVLFFVTEALELNTLCSNVQSGAVPPSAEGDEVQDTTRNCPMTKDKSCFLMNFKLPIRNFADVAPVFHIVSA